MRKATQEWDGRQRKLLPTEEGAEPEVREGILGQLRQGVLHVIREIFEEQKQELIGDLWSRKTEGQARSGGTEEGHAYLEGRRVRVRYPRIREGAGSRAVPAYGALRSFDLMSEEVMPALVRGVSTRDYRGVVSRIVEGTGLSKSTVSRAFVRASRKSLHQVNGRDLSKQCFAALFLDGISFGETTVVAALGVSLEGRKVLLGLAEGYTENATVVSQLLDNLVDRGLALSERFLAVVDGGKALKAALVQRWGKRVVLARCQLHKKRNVVEHLPPSYHAEVRRRMSVAYGMKEEGEARKVLENTVRWLSQISEPAARSLSEGLEETLTVVRLGLPEVLRKSFSTTNAVESLFDGVRTRTGRVKRWRRGKSEMVLRWAAATGLEGERRLRRIRGYALLGLLVERLTTIDVDVVKEVG